MSLRAAQRASRGIAVVSICSCSASAQWTPPALSIQRIGLLDSEHTRADGFASSTPLGVSIGAQVIGQSDRFDGYNGNGSSAWTFIPGIGTVRLGLVDAAHTRSNGFQRSRPRALNAAGAVIGTSDRFSGTSSNGSSAWIWNKTDGLSRLGYTDPNFSTAGGYEYSDAVAINAAGQVIGFSTLAGGTQTTNDQAWIWSQAAGLTPIGLADAAHTGVDGARNNTVIALNDAGQVVGFADHFDGPANLGQHAWIWTSGLDPVIIGLTDADHTDPSGWQSSKPVAISSTGAVAGIAARFSGAANIGRSAWVWTAATGAQAIGIMDAEHTSADGTQANNVQSITSFAGNPAVVGIAARYVGSVERGQSAWVWTAASATRRLGFTDAPHTSSNGAQRSTIGAINIHGRVLGASAAYNGAATISMDPWIYDLATNQLTPFTPPLDDLTSFSAVLLTDDDAVLGVLTSPSHTGGVPTPYIWSAQNGLALAADLLGASAGWDFTTTLTGTSTAPALVGRGNTSGSAFKNEMTYALLPPCPADITHDSVVDLSDFFAFFNGFDAGDPSADVDQSGDVDLLDFFTFFNHWDLGC